jgi:hypothetical protein
MHGRYVYRRSRCRAWLAGAKRRDPFSQFFRCGYRKGDDVHILRNSSTVEDVRHSFFDSLALPGARSCDEADLGSSVLRSEPLSLFRRCPLSRCDCHVREV